jgi:hypothetical protein
MQSAMLLTPFKGGEKASVEYQSWFANKEGGKRTVSGVILFTVRRKVQAILRIVAGRVAHWFVLPCFDATEYGVFQPCIALTSYV